MPHPSSQQQQPFFEGLEGRALLSWGTQGHLIGQDLVAQQFPQLTGAGESVAVIDSGIDYNHPVLGGGWGNKVIAGWDFGSNDSDPMSSSYAHGTGVAGMIGANGYDYGGAHYQGIAPGAKLIALRETNTNGVVAALKWVIANKTKYNIVSLNFTDFGGGNRDTAASIKSSLNTLSAMGVYASSPSGNGGSASGANGYGIEAVVGSVNKGDGISGFTNRGPGLDFLAPGEKVTVPYYDVGSHKHIYVDVADGTSWSAPQIAGAAAILRQIDPGFSNGEITSILKDSAVYKYDSKSHLSYARLNLYGAVRLAYQRAGKSVPPPISNPAPTPAPVTPQAPGGVVASTPTTIGTNTTVLQVEDFDSGAEGAAYHDTDKVNTGGNNYRPGTGVDVISINDQNSTRAVGIVKAGEWLKYTVNVQATGAYNLEFRVAGLGSGGQFHLEVDGRNVTGTLNVPDTKNWNAYGSVLKTGVGLASGKHTLRLVFDRNGKTGYVGNFNLIRITKTGAPTSALTGPSSSAFKTFNLAAGTTATIQAEDFDNGANGVAYRDTTANNEGKQYRTNVGVDIEKSTDSGGGYDVGYLKQGEWLDYTVNVTKAGTFNFDARVASPYSGATFHVEIDGKNVTGSIAFTNTGNFQKWTTLRKTGIKIAAGKHTVRVVVDSSAGHRYAGNLNWFKFS
jgi:subtilisin family serine protease